MKRIAAITLIGWLLLAGSIWASQVTNVALTYQDGSTVARIDIQGPVRFTHQTEVPKDGRPDRVIVDVLSATHALGAKEFLSLPSCVVTGIRSSQYAVSPEKIVRIVFDLGTTPVYQVDSDDQGISIKFSHRESQSFAAWSSRSGVAAPVETPAPAVAEAPREVAPATATVAARNESIEKDRLASLSDQAGEKPKAEPKPVVVAKEEPVAAPIVTDFSGQAFADGWSSQSWKPKSASVFPSAAAKPDPVVVAQTPPPAKVETKPVEPIQPAPEPVAQPAVEPSGAASLVELPDAAPGSLQPKQELSVQQPEVKTESPVVKDEPSFETLEDKFAYPPLQFPTLTQAPTPPAQETEPTPTVAEPAPTVAAVESESAAVSPVPTESVPATDLTSEEKVASLGIPKANLLDEADFAPAVELPATVKPEDMSKVVVADATTPPADKTAPRATARFRREAQSDKIRGTMVAEFPERLVIQYQTESRRDPFDPLIDDTKSFNNPVEDRIPNVEGLKLVGILESEAGNNRALFEDKGGFSYILQSGDKVRNGYVLRVEPDQVYFQIFEYGWSRTVALTMEY